MAIRKCRLTAAEVLSRKSESVSTGQLDFFGAPPAGEPFEPTAWECPTCGHGGTAGTEAQLVTLAAHHVCQQGGRRGR